MKVVIAPDSFKGVLRPPEAAEAIAAGWGEARPDDELVCAPLSDGGDGLLDVLAGSDAHEQLAEVVGPLGRPVQARWLARGDGTAVIESAQACGLQLLAEDQRDPLVTTTWGVGQLLENAREAGAGRILIGMGGSATVDGGAGALSGLGFRLATEDGSGLKIGGGGLHRVASAEGGWAGDWRQLEIHVLCDVTTALLDAPGAFGPQKGADRAAVAVLEDGLARWAEVAERDLAAPGLRDQPGTGAAGGLAFGLAAGLGAELVEGAGAVADEVGLDDALADADLVVTGEGELEASSFEGKVVGALLERARAPVVAVVGRLSPGLECEEPGGRGPGDAPGRLAGIAEASPQGPGERPDAEVAAAAARLAGQWSGRGKG